MCAQTRLCVLGPDNGPHSSPTSVTSFVAMTPAHIVKRLSSYESDDTAVPLVPTLFRLWLPLSLCTEWIAGPALRVRLTGVSDS